MVRRSFHLKKTLKSLILSDSLQKNFSTVSLDVFSVTGGRPAHLREFFTAVQRISEDCIHCWGERIGKLYLKI